MLGSLGKSSFTVKLSLGIADPKPLTVAMAGPPSSMIQFGENRAWPLQGDAGSMLRNALCGERWGPCEPVDIDQPSWPPIHGEGERARAMNHSKLPWSRCDGWRRGRWT